MTYYYIYQKTTTWKHGCNTASSLQEVLLDRNVASQPTVRFLVNNHQ